MDVIKRLTKLRALVECAGGDIQTKKKLHKLVYLLQAKSESFGQDFTFLHYGVFSHGLASDLNLAEEAGLLTVEDLTDKNEGYVIGIGTESVSSDKTLVGGSGSQLIDALGDKEPRLLEALSTIVYLHKAYYSGDELREKLAELKPKLSQFYEDAFELAEEHFEIEVPEHCL